MKLLLVDDHILFREGLASLLHVQSDIKVVGQAGNVREAVQLATHLSPSLILMDFGLPDGTGLDATRTILATQPETKIVFLTVDEDDEHLFQAIRIGAKGYLLKNVPVATLLTYLRGVERGEAALMPAMTTKILTKFSRLTEPTHAHKVEIETLTLREAEVWKYLQLGASNREIAGRLVISENTVKNHVRNILTKLNLHSRRQVITHIHKSS